jgi:hypothetical protein
MIVPSLFLDLTVCTLIVAMFTRAPSLADRRLAPNVQLECPRAAFVFIPMHAREQLRKWANDSLGPRAAHAHLLQQRSLHG